MVSFISLKKYLTVLGLRREETNIGKILKIASNCAFLGLLVTFLLSTLWYFCFDAKVLADYTGCFYFMSCALLPMAWYLNYLWKRNEYTKLFTDLDEIIEKRELLSFLMICNLN